MLKKAIKFQRWINKSVILDNKGLYSNIFWIFAVIGN